MIKLPVEDVFKMNAQTDDPQGCIEQFKVWRTQVQADMDANPDDVGFEMNRIQVETLNLFISNKQSVINKKCKKIAISEIFGPTIQGEGASIGYPTIFVRTGGCDYRCSWCDTQYAVDTKYIDDWKPMSAESIMDKIRELSNNKPMLVTFSGGNPALYDLSDVIEIGHSDGYTFTMETQGSIPREWFDDLDFITFSPKPPSSGMETDWDKLSQSITYAGDLSNSSIKVVVDTDDDYQYALEAFNRYPDLPRYITPCNTTPGEPNFDDLYSKCREITQRILDDGYFDVSVLPQLHVLLWGNERGK
jgi:7-carboxy-7-deazaguanine synthase